MAKNWIAGATKNKGALHRALGVPQGERSGEETRRGCQEGRQDRQEARLAETLKKMHKK